MRAEEKIKSNSDASNPYINENGSEALKRFRLIFRAVQRHAQMVETSCNLSNAQLWAISELSQNPGMSVTALAKAMAIQQSTASNLLDKLVKRGMVRRDRINTDQRVVSLFLTNDGLKALVISPKPARGILQDSLFNLPDGTLIQIISCLDELIKVMDIEDDTAATQPINL
jgi:DNA-binding MarR family transcriptional regulator